MKRLQPTLIIALWLFVGVSAVASMASSLRAQDDEPIAAADCPDACSIASDFKCCTDAAGVTWYGSRPAKPAGGDEE